MPPPFLQPSCALRSRFEAVLKGVRLIKHAGWRGPESDCGDDAEQNEKRQDDELRDFEWRLGLRRSHRFQGRNFFEGLHDQNEQVKVETDDSTDRIDPTPCTAESFGVTRVNRQRKKRQRYDSETDGRREPVKRKKESSEGCCDGRYQKPFRPTV